MKCYRSLPISGYFVSLCLMLLLLAETSPVYSQQVSQWQLGKLQFFEQVANNSQPTTPVEFDFSGFLETDTFGYFDEVTLENAPGGTLNYFGEFDDGSGNFRDWFFEVVDTDQSALDAAYPNQSYDIEATGPGGVDFIETVDLTGFSFPSEIPFFNGQTFNDLQSVNASQPITLTWNMPPTDGFGLDIEDITSGQFVYDICGVNNVPGCTLSTQQSIVLPAGTLQPDTDYQISLIFADTEPDPADTGGFPTGTGFAFHGNITFMSFSTSAVPEPTTLMLCLIGTAALVSRVRRRATT